MIFLLSRFVNDDFNNTDTISINNSSDTPTAVMSTVNPTSNPTVKPTVKPTMKPTSEPTVNPTGNPTGNLTVNPTVNPTVKPTVKPASKPVVRIRPRVSLSEISKPKPNKSRRPNKKRRNKSNYKRNNQGDRAFYKSWKYVRRDNTNRTTIQVPSGQYILAICITADVSYFISYHVIQ